ncbi:hypothetical protein NDU88_001515 [Pleurodeles waltl]|uniref:Peflin n=1 Tax=Pleurodeles waltl TaxID=8319 RepID=A0AAV7V7Z7_PLEWA|nr:hypothetical protein NDU88_001515 [Pleurodeles waltl]
MVDRNSLEKGLVSMQHLEVLHMELLEDQMAFRHLGAHMALPRLTPMGHPSRDSMDKEHPVWLHHSQGAQAGIGELQLVHLNNEACQMMINMFDKTKTRRIDILRFAAMWRFIQQWRTLFQQYDRDISETISAGELLQVLSQMGYNLSPQFTQILMIQYCT